MHMSNGDGNGFQSSENDKESVYRFRDKTRSYSKAPNYLSSIVIFSELCKHYILLVLQNAL